jgi:hypothetical protein
MARMCEDSISFGGNTHSVLEVVNMDNSEFDRITKNLAAHTVRRRALKASVGGLLVAAVASAGRHASAKDNKKKKKKKKQNNNTPSCPPPPPRCLNPREICTTTASCCGAEFGVTACQQATKATCPPGLHCCIIEGAVCNLSQASCDCCGNLVCTQGAQVGPRCKPPEL